MLKLFKKREQKTQTVSFVLRNEDCYRLFEEFGRDKMPTCVDLMIVYRLNDDDFFVMHNIPNEQLTSNLDKLHIKSHLGEI